MWNELRYKKDEYQKNPEGYGIKKHKSRSCYAIKW